MDLRETEVADIPPVSDVRNEKLLFLDRHAAGSEIVSQYLPYRLTCELFHCGIIDRTNTLELGFDAEVLDPLDELEGSGETNFDELCSLRAESLLEESADADRTVDVLWSGGIDSTVALIALIRMADEMRCRDRLRVLCSIDSIAEYKSFFYDHIWDKLQVVPVGFPVSSYLSADSIIVTGEHGDQLYGSDFLQPYVENGLASKPWKVSLPFALAANSVGGEDAKTITDYLEPLMQACPTGVETLFDFFWWLNFSSKWQSVALRIAANASQPRSIYDSTRHFFRDARFQHWSLFQRDRSTIETWTDYKMPSKQYIFGFTGDEDYLANKQKERSLRLIFAGEPKKKTARKKKKTTRSKVQGLILNTDFKLACVLSTAT